MIRSDMSEKVRSGTKDLMTVLPMADVLWTWYGEDGVIAGSCQRRPWRWRELSRIKDVLIKDWRGGHWHEVGFIGVICGRVMVADHRCGVGVGTDR
jgi:hypothetical protein